MTSEVDFSYRELSELNDKCERLKQLREEKIRLRNEYMERNNTNEAILRRLQVLKEHHDYLKEMLRMELFKKSTSLGKQGIIMSNLLNGFHVKNEHVKLQYQRLPNVVLVKEITEHNKQLMEEIVKAEEMLENNKMEYMKLLKLWQKKLTEKIVEFSCEFSKVHIKKGGITH